MFVITTIAYQTALGTFHHLLYCRMFYEAHLAQPCLVGVMFGKYFSVWVHLKGYKESSICLTLEGWYLWVFLCFSHHVIEFLPLGRRRITTPMLSTLWRLFAQAKLFVLFFFAGGASLNPVILRFVPFLGGTTVLTLMFVYFLYTSPWGHDWIWRELCKMHSWKWPHSWQSHICHAVTKPFVGKINCII